MGREHVSHSDIVRFADERVNLKREDAKEAREQVWRLRDKLEEYLKEHPDFDLRKILLSGSLAKGTALKSLNDIDVACYVSADKAPASISELIDWLARQLRTAFPNLKPEQVKPNQFSVTISFVGTGLRVDVVPILYADDPDWKGYLVATDTGEKLLTSIPMHLDFIRRRKAVNEVHFAQIIRLLKFWIKLRKQEDEQFRFKSFMAELIVTYLADRGKLLMSDYPEALAQVFAFIASDNFRTDIVFSDYYDLSKCRSNGQAIRIWDPVNHENNVAKLYTTGQKNAITNAALDAGDAVDAALRATTKTDTLRYWRKVFGPTFEA